MSFNSERIHISFLKFNPGVPLLSFAMFLCVFVTTVNAQSALDGFNPNVNDLVRAVITQPDGKILIAGDFTQVAGVNRSRIARLNADGTLDMTFNPNANDNVFSLALQADGKILAAGIFTNIGGQTRNFIARLDQTTGAADSFNPNADNLIRSIAVQSDGKVLAGGDFTNIGGQARSRIARIDQTNGTADSFNPNAGATVQSLIVQADGKILAGGNFNNIGGQTRNFIARLDAATGTADAFNPNADASVRSIALQADGKVLAGGDFTNIGGQARSHIARLDAAAGTADSFNPNANDIVQSIVVQPDGKVLAGGFFTNIGAQTRNHIARLDAATGAADAFNPNADTNVFSIAVQPDGKVLTGGVFMNVGGQMRNRMARLEIDGRLDQTLNINAFAAAGNEIRAIVVQQDGKILIGGGFTQILGVTRNRIARLNTDGTLDMTFNPNVDNFVYTIALQTDGKILIGGNFNFVGAQFRSRIARLDPTTGAADSFNPAGEFLVQSIAVQTDGKIIVGGNFTTIGGQNRVGIARLDPVTGMADSFDPNPNGTVRSIAIQPDGKILVSGGFTVIGGQTRNRIARLDPATGLADSLNPNADAEIYSLALQADGKILAGGDFTSIGGQARGGIARIDQTTGLADSFNPGNNGSVSRINSIVVQSDGKILAGGAFTNIGGQMRNNIARLDRTTGAADSFDPNADAEVFSIALQADGKVLAGGIFTNAGGQARVVFVRLSNNIAALQNLSASQTTVTWIRGGSGPVLSRVIFEQSNDAVNYTFLGNGTGSGATPETWTLTNQNLPTGQNIYIRAKGYYRSGFVNGSESIVESVRSAFIPGITADLSVTKVDTPDPVTAGGNLTYTITTANAGPNDAASAVLSDTLPAGTTFVSLVSPGGWSCTTPAVGTGGGAVSCSNPNLGVGNAAFTLTVNVAANTPAGTIISNTATISSATADSNAGNNTSNAATTVLSPAAVTGTKTAGGTLNPGGTVTYIVTLSNSGPAAQQDNPGNEFTDVLPVGLTLVSASATMGTAVASTGTNTVTWNGSISAGGAVTITITAAINAGTGGQTVSNQGSISYDSDGNGTNEASAVTDDPGTAAANDATSFVIATNADLSVTKTGSLAKVIAGNNIAYTINITNNGPDNASMAMLIDVIPANTTFQSIAAPAGWSCTTPAVNSTGTVTCTSAAALANSANAGFILIVNVNTGTANGIVITNTASVTSAATDTSTSNNTATAATTVNEFSSPQPTGLPPKALLVKPAAGNTTAGGGISDSSCVAPIGVTAAGIFANINQALGSANTGDTIYVCPKYTAGAAVPYVEQVSLGFTNLSIIGISDNNGQRAIIAANPSTPTTPTTQLGTNYIVQILAAGVNFGNFVVDGAPAGVSFAGTGIFNGIVVRRSGAFVFNNTVQNIGTGDTAANSNGQGIAVFGAGSAASPIEAGTTSSPVNVLNNIIQNYRSNGVNVSSGSSSSYAFIRGNYIIGSGAATATTNQSGVQFQTGANGDIFNNRVTNILNNNASACSTAEFGNCSTGIRLNTTSSVAGNSLRVRFNLISNTQTGIFAQDVQYVSLTNNTISNSVTDGVNLRGSSLNLGSNFSTITQNTILSSRRAGIFLGIPSGDASLGNVISTNTINDAYFGVEDFTPPGNNGIVTTGAAANMFINVNQTTGNDGAAAGTAINQLP